MGIQVRLEAVYDLLEAAWESPRVNQAFATLIVVSFLVTLLLAEVGRVGLIPIVRLPGNHFAAVHLAFTLLWSRRS